MAVWRILAVTPNDLKAMGVELEITRQTSPFPAIHIVSKIGAELPNYRFKRVRLIVASEDVTPRNVERITTEGPHILSSSYSTDRRSENDFIGSRRWRSLLIFEYQKTDEEFVPMIWLCLPISTLIDEPEKG